MLRLQDYLPYRLSVAANVVSRWIARAYEQRFALTIPQWRLLAVLADEGAATPQALCRRTVMDKVTVMRAARGLLARRLVTRRPNAQDGRSHRLVLSGAGESLYRRIVPLALAHEARLLRGIDAREVARFQRLLQRIQHSAIAAAELDG